MSFFFLFFSGTLLLKVLENRYPTHNFGFFHGSLTLEKRDELVKRFQEQNRDSNSAPLSALVVSLKSGGAGLTLTAASTVIHYDRWWNPAVEDQASDRAHRVGQDKTVFVYKLVCSGTLEEKIDEALCEKKLLQSLVIRKSDQGIRELDQQKLKELLKLIPA